MIACEKYLDGCKCKRCSAREYEILAEGEPSIPKAAAPREVSGEAAPTKEFNADKAMVAVWKATIERDSREIERAAVEMDVYEFRTFALSIVRRWLGKSQEIIR